MESTELKNYIVFSVIVILFYLFLNFCGITCPVKYITGISCAGCGMTRAWLSLFGLDIKEAFKYHPLFVLPAVFALFFIFKNRIPHKIYIGFIILSILVFIIVYLVRLANPEDTIIEINIKEGLIGRFIQN